MGTAKDEHVEDESMSDVDYENLKEDEESEDDEYLVESTEDGRDDGGNTDTLVEDQDVPVVVRRAGRRKCRGDIAADEKDHDKVMSEAGSDPGVETVEQENGEVVPGKLKRRRLHGRRDRQRARNTSWPDDAVGMHGRDWEEDSEDDDWVPIGSVKWLWFCTNCTTPNYDNSSACGNCGEHRKSGILTEGHLASSTASLLLPRASAVEGAPALNKDSSSRIFPVDPSKCGKTVIGFDERMLLHEETPMKSRPHPERPDRLRAIVAGLEAEGLFPGRCAQRPAREVTRSELEKVHSGEHVDAVELTCNSEEMSYFTDDTYANKDSSLAARIAAGICADMATAIVKGEAHNGFALVRPPGHHAEEQAVMGFCLHNNAAVAAKAAQAAGARKVLIVDWDVHHGNGTQDIFENDPLVLYVSLHRHEGGKFYPGTGAAAEVGSGEGEGASVNIPWCCSGIGDGDYIFAFLHIVIPIARQFAPDITIVSAGFDAAVGDPLGGCETKDVQRYLSMSISSSRYLRVSTHTTDDMCLLYFSHVTPSGYAHMTSMLNSISGGKMLVVLEGGYNLRSISASATAVVKVLLGDGPGPLPEDVHPTAAGAASMLDVLTVQSRYWAGLFKSALLQQIVPLAASHNHSKELLSGEVDQELASSPSVQRGQSIGSPACVG